MCIRDRLHTDLLQALNGEHLSSVISTDGTLISASAASHCGAVPRPVNGDDYHAKWKDLAEKNS